MPTTDKDTLNSIALKPTRMGLKPVKITGGRGVGEYAIECIPLDGEWWQYCAQSRSESRVRKFMNGQDAPDSFTLVAKRFPDLEAAENYIEEHYVKLDCVPPKRTTVRTRSWWYTICSVLSRRKK